MANTHSIKEYLVLLAIKCTSTLNVYTTCVVLQSIYLSVYLFCINNYVVMCTRVFHIPYKYIHVFIIVHLLSYLFNLITFTLINRRNLIFAYIWSNINTYIMDKHDTHIFQLLHLLWRFWSLEKKVLSILFSNMEFSGHFGSMNQNKMTTRWLCTGYVDDGVFIKNHFKGITYWNFDVLLFHCGGVSLLLRLHKRSCNIYVVAKKSSLWRVNF